LTARLEPSKCPWERPTKLQPVLSQTLHVNRRVCCYFTGEGQVEMVQVNPSYLLFLFTMKTAQRQSTRKEGALARKATRDGPHQRSQLNEPPTTPLFDLQTTPSLFLDGKKIAQLVPERPNVLLAASDTAGESRDRRSGNRSLFPLGPFFRGHVRVQLDPTWDSNAIL